MRRCEKMPKKAAPIINNFDPPTHFSDHMVLLYGQLNYQFFAKFDLEHTLEHRAHTNGI